MIGIDGADQGPDMMTLMNALMARIRRSIAALAEGCAALVSPPERLRPLPVENRMRNRPACPVTGPLDSSPGRPAPGIRPLAARVSGVPLSARDESAQRHLERHCGPGRSGSGRGGSGSA